MECRQRIIRAAIDFFSRFGVKAVTMDFLAEQLGISKRTIYENFRSKEELLSACIRLWIVDHRQRIKTIINRSSNIIEAIHQISITSEEVHLKAHPLFFHELKKYFPEIYQSILNEGDYRDDTITRNILERGILEGVFDADLNIHIVNIYWQELIAIIHDPDKFPAGTYSQQELVENIMHPFIRGICTDKGLRLLRKYFVRMGNEPLI